jgi:hypothetical protein
MNDVFARRFLAEHPTDLAFFGAHPGHDLVAEKVKEVGLAIVMGHDGGGTLRAASDGPPWADADQFARMFAGARVWVYACDSCSRTQDDLGSFGARAVAQGVRIFVGHTSPITAPPPFDSIPQLRDATYRALARGFRRFLLGSDSATEIRNHALGARGRGTALVSLSIEDALRSLRVLRADIRG